MRYLLFNRSDFLRGRWHCLEDVRWQMPNCRGWCAAPRRAWSRTRLSPCRLQPQLFCRATTLARKPHSPSFAPGKGRKLHGASQFPPHLASSCRFFCPHQFGKNAQVGRAARSLLGRWIGYTATSRILAHFQPLKFRSITQRVKENTGKERWRHDDLATGSDFDPDRDTDKTFGPGCEITVVWSEGSRVGQVTSEICGQQGRTL